MACWARTNDDTIDQTCFSINDVDTANNQWMLRFRGDSVGDPINFSCKAGGTAASAVTTTGFTANTWAHVCGVEASATDRRVFINGGSKGTNATSRTPSGIDNVAIGRNGDSTPDGYFSGDIAAAAIWNVALADADVALLALGVSPFLVHPESLVFYPPLIGRYNPEIDIRGGYAMTVTGAVASPHPRMFYPSQGVS